MLPRIQLRKIRHHKKITNKTKPDKESSISDHEESFARANEDVKNDNFPELPILEENNKSNESNQIKEIKPEDLLSPKKTSSNTTVRLTVSNRIK